MDFELDNTLVMPKSLCNLPESKKPIMPKNQTIFRTDKWSATPLKKFSTPMGPKSSLAQENSKSPITAFGEQKPQDKSPLFSNFLEKSAKKQNYINWDIGLQKGSELVFQEQLQNLIQTQKNDQVIKKTFYFSFVFIFELLSLGFIQGVFSKTETEFFSWKILIIILIRIFSLFIDLKNIWEKQEYKIDNQEILRKVLRFERAVVFSLLSRFILILYHQSHIFNMIFIESGQLQNNIVGVFNWLLFISIFKEIYYVHNKEEKILYTEESLQRSFLNQLCDYFSQYYPFIQQTISLLLGALKHTFQIKQSYQNNSSFYQDFIKTCFAMTLLQIYFIMLQRLYIILSRLIYLQEFPITLWKQQPGQILGLLQQAESRVQMNSYTKNIVYQIYNHFLKHEQVIFNNYFSIEELESNENNIKFQTVKSLFGILVGKITTLEKEIKKKSYDQKVVFDLYDKIFSFYYYLNYSNDERELINDTYSELHLWRIRFKFIQSLLYKLKNNSFIEYKVEEIKDFIQRCINVQNDLQKILENYEQFKDQKSIDFNEDTLEDYWTFCTDLKEFTTNINLVLFDTKYD